MTPLTLVPQDYNAGSAWEAWYLRLQPGPLDTAYEQFLTRRIAQASRARYIAKVRKEKN